MNQSILKGGIVLATLLALLTCQGCFKLQRAVGCNNPGIFGCKDKPSEIQDPDPGLQPAPPAPSSPEEINTSMDNAEKLARAFGMAPVDLLGTQVPGNYTQVTGVRQTGCLRP